METVTTLNRRFTVRGRECRVYVERELVPFAPFVARGRVVGTFVEVSGQRGRVRIDASYEAESVVESLLGEVRS